MRWLASVCFFAFPLLLILMEAAFKADSHPEWSFAPPALAATAVALLISSLKVKSKRQREILGEQYTTILEAESDVILVLTFLLIVSLALWAWIIHETSMDPVPKVFWGISRPLACSIGAFLFSQGLVTWREATYG